MRAVRSRRGSRCRSPSLADIEGQRGHCERQPCRGRAPGLVAAAGWIDVEDCECMNWMTRFLLARVRSPLPPVISSKAPAVANNSAEAVAPILTTRGCGRRHSFARPLGSAGDPCRARPQCRFRRQAGSAARRPSTSTAAGRQGNRPRRQRAAKSTAITDASQGLAVQGRPRNPNLGAPLAIALRPDTSRIVITYKSAPDAGALLWLTPAADRRQEDAVPVQPGRGDPEPELDPDPGFARHPPDLGSEDPRAGGHDRR